MVAEIISVGTELLLGSTVDSDSAYLGRTLAALGIDLYFKQTVGDNLDRAVVALQLAASRAELIVTCGGLGPTEDDLTKEAVARALDDELVLDPVSEEQVRAVFARRRMPMVESNLRQAMIFRSGRAIPNDHGTAPGALLEKGGKTVICLPGPPRELIPMVEGFVVPYLTERLGAGRQVLRSRVLRTIGIGESTMEERVRDLLATRNPTVAPLAHLGEAHLRITAKAASEAEAEALIAPLEAELRRRLGDAIYGTDEHTLEEAVVDLLAERQRTLAVAESVTGGLLGARLTNVPHSSDVFLGGLITYTNAAKRELLGIPSELLDRHGAVSDAVARQMAVGVRQRFGTALGVGITGLAGPGGGTEEKPVGLVFVGIAAADRVEAREYRFLGSRGDIRQRAATVALEEIRRTLLDTVSSR
jgi:nicotinamide-nucleotide amidase